MITRFIDGTYIDSNYINALKDDNREFLARFMLNGTEVNCGIKRVEFTKGSCGNTDQFSIGSIFGSSMTAEVLDLTDDVKNQVLELQIGLYVEASSAWRWIKVGEYKITEVNKNIYGATLVGYGKIVANSSGTFTEPATKTIANIATEIGTELGCTVYIGNIDGTKEITESMYGLTTYQALQVLTSVIGGFAYDRNDGNVSIDLFSTTSYLAVDTSLMTSLPEVEEQDYEITGVRCIVAEASEDSEGEIAEVGYEQGSPVNLIFNDKYMTQSLFTTFANNMIGYTYRPGKINLSLGNPRLEGYDNLQVTDVNGSVYIVPCHQIRHVYDGGFRSEIVSAKATNLENNIGSVAPLQDFMKSTDQNFVRMQSEFDTLANGVQYFFHDDEGAHVCTIPQEQYNNMYYNQTCVEVLITSSSIIFRQVKRGLSSKVYTVYATYGSSGITLGDYASMTSNGIILGDINNQYYQLVLNATEGLKLNGDQIVISDYSTSAVTEVTTTARYCAGLLSNDAKTVSFTVPLECLTPEGTSINITTLIANIKVAGMSYCLDYPYTNGGVYFSGGSTYTIVGQVIGTSMTISISKSTAFTQNRTTTAATGLSALVVELNGLRWTKPASNRAANLLKAAKVEDSTDEEITK